MKKLIAILCFVCGTAIAGTNDYMVLYDGNTKTQTCEGVIFNNVSNEFTGRSITLNGTTASNWGDVVEATALGAMYLTNIVNVSVDEDTPIVIDTTNWWVSSNNVYFSYVTNTLVYTNTPPHTNAVATIRLVGVLLVEMDTTYGQNQELGIQLRQNGILLRERTEEIDAGDPKAITIHFDLLAEYGDGFQIWIVNYTTGFDIDVHSLDWWMKQ